MPTYVSSSNSTSRLWRRTRSCAVSGQMNCGFLRLRHPPTASLDVGELPATLKLKRSRESARLRSECGAKPPSEGSFPEVGMLEFEGAEPKEQRREANQRF